MLSLDTERTSSYQKILDRIRDRAWIMDRSGQICLVNAAWQNFIGRSHTSSTLTLWDLFPIAERDAAKMQWEQNSARLWQSKQKLRDTSIVDEKVNDEVNIFEAEDPKHKKLEYAIFFNQKIEVTQVSKLYVEVFKKLFEIQPETFFTTDLGERIGLAKNPNEIALRQAVPISDTYFIEANIDNKGKFDRMKQALTND